MSTIGVVVVVVVIVRQESTEDGCISGETNTHPMSGYTLLYMHTEPALSLQPPPRLRKIETLTGTLSSLPSGL